MNQSRETENQFESFGHTANTSSIMLSGPQTTEIWMWGSFSNGEGNVAECAVARRALHLVFLQEKNGRLRLCVTYCRLIAVTVRGSYLILCWQECKGIFGRVKIFPTLAAKLAYGQNIMEKKDVNPTTAVCHTGLCKNNRMLFGLKNDSTTFQKPVDVLPTSVRY